MSRSRTTGPAVPATGEAVAEDLIHVACPACNPPDAEFVTTLCGIAQDPSEQVPPIGAVCGPCRGAAATHPCFSRR